jgi:hypothetical protein
MFFIFIPDKKQGQCKGNKKSQTDIMDNDPGKDNVLGTGKYLVFYFLRFMVSRINARRPRIPVGFATGCMKASVSAGIPYFGTLNKSAPINNTVDGGSDTGHQRVGLAP